MEVRLAKTAGFCFGVKRAVETVYEQIKKQECAQKKLPIYTYGPIIHNEQVVRDLEEKGVRVLETKEELEALEEGIVIIRSHGVGRDVCGLIEKKGLVCVDATCPFVKRIHNIVEKESKAGKQIIIIGNPGHPEVEGICGWCSSPAITVESEEEMEKLEIKRGSQVYVVSQTTFNYNKFEKLVDILKRMEYNSNVVNTICSATEERQAEARNIARLADVMIVIGGAHSSNTGKLFEICSNECARTCFIQTLADLNPEILEGSHLVGITAGASTPNNIIEEVQNYVRNEF